MKSLIPAPSLSHIWLSRSLARRLSSRLRWSRNCRKNWEGRLSNYVRASYKTNLLSGNAGALGQLIQKIFDIAILWVGAHMVMAGSLTIGGLIAFRMLSGRVSGPVLRLVQSWQDFSANRYFHEAVG